MSRALPRWASLVGLVVVAVSCAPPAAPAPALRVPRFTDVTPAELPAGLPAPVPGFTEQLTHALFADVDGDGSDDLVLSHEEVPAKAYAWREGAWRPLAPGSPALPWGALGFADVDGDGDQDMLRAGEVSWNDGRGSFSSTSAFTELGWARASNMAVADVDADGWLDVLGGGICCRNAGCRDLGVALRTGARTFRLLDESNGLRRGPWLKSYLAAWVPLDPEPLLVQLGEPCGAMPDGESPFYRIERDGGGWPRLVAVEPLPDDATFRLGKPGLSLPTRAPMGAVSADFDLDGRLDLALGTNPYQELFQGGDRWPMRALGGATGILGTPGPRLFQLPWAMHAPDLDLDGRPDLVIAHGDDGNARNRPEDYIGPQQTGIYLGTGDFKFADVTAQAGMPSGHWRSIALGDFDCDGDADLGVGAIDAWPRIYRNDTDAEGHAISLRLRGTTSNTLGFGARVELWPDGAGQPLRLVAGGPANPGSFSEPIVFAALTPASRAARVRVTWPSGTVQELTQLVGGRCHVVVEPPVLEFSPPTRRARAGEPVTVTVTPRDPAGRPRAARIEARVTHGEASLRSRPIGAGVVLTLTSDAPGSAVLEITLDGVAMGVRPRLWWGDDVP